MRLSAIVVFLVFGPAFIGAAFAADQPNVLIIMADDCTFSDLPLYGGRNARTPHIDQIASQGLTFEHAYLSEAMCQPCRAELFSGLFPMRNGCNWNHSASLPQTTSMPQHLGKVGYRVGIAGKVHVLPKQAFPFEKVGGFDSNCVRNPTQACDPGSVREFMSRSSEQPFCLVVALVEPHVPWVMGDASAYPPKQIKLPANLASTPKTREAFSRYLAEITYMDGQVGTLMRTLAETEHDDDTLVLFTSEQGAQFPGCKWTNWDTGLHTALVARYPGVVPAGKRTDAIVQYADVLPTLLELAGNKPGESELDGSSFAGVLKGNAHSHRKYAYGTHNNIPEGPAYPIRTVTNGQYRYIRNLQSDNLYIEKHLMGIKGNGQLNNPYWQQWIFDSGSNPGAYRLVQRYMQRPAEELYHTQMDPYELRNLASSPAAAEIKSELSQELDRWMKSQGDPGAQQDTPQSHQAAKAGNHRFRAPMTTEKQSAD
ncbi:sulfatase [Planctomycetes bacterium K23_9]|uniref:Choline-sulfatase n=1 Tax=Stieleria marina TaxID=1930275 RepID=A0A517NQS2_9BACT|nr:Choline-sulfatase [Planctomycetes bacterium K23_9]